MTKPMLSRDEANQAITQLLCLILGGHQARASAHLFHNIPERLELCSNLVQQDLEHALQSHDPNVTRDALGTAQRKLTSLQSLKTLNQLIQECEW